MTNLITFDLADLKTACAMLARVVEKKTRIPILACVLFDGRGNVSATDLDIEFTYRLDGTFDHAPFTVELAQLAKVIKGAARGGLVKMSHDTESGTVVILSDGLESNEESMPATDMPEWIKRDGAPHCFDMTESELHGALSFVAPCMSDEQTRYYLRGVYLTQYRDALTMVSTNGHQLAKLETGHGVTSDDDSPMGEGRGVIMPDKAVKIALATIGAKPSDSLIAVKVQELNITIGARKWSMRCKPVDGSFPDWTRIMPKESGAWAELDRAELLKATTRLAGICDNPALQLKAWDSATLSSDGGKRSMPVKTVAGGEAVEIAFDHAYLTSACKAFDTDNLHVSVSSAGDPAAFTVGGDRTRLRVVMPMRY